MRIRSNLLPVTVLASFLLLASCGGSDSSESTDSTDNATEISKADFVEQANARCTSLSETLSSAQAGIGSAPTEEQIATFMTDVLVAEYRATLDYIRDLGFPAGDESLLEGILDDADKVLDDIAADPIASLASPESPFLEVNVAFQDYGLTVCAET